jgi:hypothetical protein
VDVMAVMADGWLDGWLGAWLWRDIIWQLAFLNRGSI